MLLSDNDEGRPLAGPASNVIADITEVDSTRCRRCGARLSARVSLDLGIGPRCRRLEVETVPAAVDPHIDLLLRLAVVETAVERLAHRLDRVVA